MKQNDQKAKTSPTDTLTQLILTAGVATRYDVDDETVRVWFRKKVVPGGCRGEWRTTMPLLLKAERRPQSHLSPERISETMRNPVSVREVKKELGVTDKTARLKMAAGDLGFTFKMGRLRYVDRRDFEDYCAMRAGSGVKWH